MIGGRVFDTSAIIDFATGRTRYAEAVVWASVEQQVIVLIPVTALAVALAGIPSRRHDVVSVLLGLPVTVVADLSQPAATEMARTLRRARRGAGALAAAHVVYCARDRSWPVLTDDPGPLRELWPGVALEPLP